MIKDFYFRNEEDPNYLPDIVETSDEIECLIYQIKMCLESNKGDVLGDVRFGVGLNDMLFTNNMKIGDIVSSLKSAVLKYSLLASNYAIDFSGKKISDGYKDFGVINISVAGKSIMGYSFGA